MMCNRRSVLAALAGAGLLGTSTVGTGAATDFGGGAVESAGDQAVEFTGEHAVLGVEVVDRQTGDRRFFADRDEVVAAELPSGRYEVHELRRGANGVEVRSFSYTAASAQAVEDGVELRVTVDYEGDFEEFVGTDEPVRVFVGAMERTDGVDRGPVSDVEIDVTVTGPSSETIDLKTATTGDDGHAVVEFDLAGAETGTYSVSVESDATNSSTETAFDVGPYTGMPFHFGSLTVGQDTTLGFYSSVDGEPESGTTRPITVRAPDGSEETVDVSFEEGGVGMLSFAPEQSGTYTFGSEESPAFTRDIESGELNALVPYFELRSQSVDGDGTVSWGAFVFEDGEPAANRDVEVTIREYHWNGEGDAVHELSATTNAFGQFTVAFDAPESTGTDYQVDLETADGQSVALHGDRISFSEGSEEESSVDLTVLYDDYQGLAPGADVDVTVSLTDEGEPVESETVTLVFAYGYENVPVATAEVETGADGSATHTFAIPEDAPDGDHLRVRGLVELDGERYTSSTGRTIQQYDVEVESFGLEPGVMNTLDVSAVDRVTGKPVADVDVTAFGNRDHVEAETFDVDNTTTDDSGEGVLELDVPADVTNDVLVNDISPYRSVSIASGTIQSPFLVDVSVSPESPTPGESVTVEYTTDTDRDVSALAVFPEREGGAVEILAEGDSVTFDVPEYLDGGESERAHLLLLADDGEATTASASVTLAEGLVADFEFSPRSPTAGETVTFEDTSTSPDVSVDTVEWDLTDDGTVDETGETVSYTYDEAGEYEVTLTVTDADGNTDSRTQAVTVEDGSERTLADYANDEGKIGINGLLNAIDDWRGGTIGITLLQDVLSYWRSGEPVE